MNAEELKQLKKGDEIFIRARFVNVLGDGDVMFSHSATNAYDKVVREDSYTHPENVIISPPAPKREPYRVNEYEDFFDVGDDKVELCVYWKDTHPNAKAAAEAERDRLNAEHRKERPHGNQ